MIPARNSSVFKKTAKQRELLQLMNHHKLVLAYGGSRSGKTTAKIRNMIIRGSKVGSRHLAVRYRFNHAKTSLMYDTIPKVFKMMGFRKSDYHENKSDYFYSWTAADGNESQLWVAGVDDKDRIEKVLGHEYSTIFCNEISQMSSDAVEMLLTRLAENVGLNLRMYLDCNPPPKSHWSYNYFHKGLNTDGSPHGLDTAWCVLNPTDNLENLPSDYIQILESLPKRKRDRFLLGLFLQDVEGALWTDEMINMAGCTEWGEIVDTVVSIDPSTTDNPGSDACGLTVCARDEFDRGVVLRDATKKLSTKVWAQTAVNLYHEFEANRIVAEVNQGGDLVKDAIHNIDSNIKVVMVTASKSKKARAEPVAMLYDQGKISHVPGLMTLEEEMTTWIPIESKWSPNGIDSIVWGFFDLFNLGKKAKKTARFGVA